MWVYALSLYVCASSFHVRLYKVLLVLFSTFLEPHIYTFKLFFHSYLSLQTPPFIKSKSYIQFPSRLSVSCLGSLPVTILSNKLEIIIEIYQWIFYMRGSRSIRVCYGNDLWDAKHRRETRYFFLVIFSTFLQNFHHNFFSKHFPW